MKERVEAGIHVWFKHLQAETNNRNQETQVYTKLTETYAEHS